MKKFLISLPLVLGVALTVLADPPVFDHFTVQFRGIDCPGDGPGHGYHQRYGANGLLGTTWGVTNIYTTNWHNTYLTQGYPQSSNTFGTPGTITYHYPDVCSEHGDAHWDSGQLECYGAWSDGTKFSATNTITTRNQHVGAIWNFIVAVPLIYPETNCNIFLSEGVLFTPAHPETFPPSGAGLQVTPIKSPAGEDITIMFGPNMAINLSEVDLDTGTVTPTTNTITTDDTGYGELFIDLSPGPLPAQHFWTATYTNTP